MLPYPDLNTLNSYLRSYVSLVPSNMDLISALDHSHIELLHALNNVTEEKSMFRYQPGKWSIKTLTMHLTDTERIFQYRALSIARGVKENLLAFDENIFAENAHADEVGFEQILIEFSLVADAFRTLFENMNEMAATQVGMANNMQISPATIGFITAGHRLHHLQVLKEKYGI
jgi:hypothetical protein